MISIVVTLSLFLFSSNAFFISHGIHKNTIRSHPNNYQYQYITRLDTRSLMSRYVESSNEDLMKFGNTMKINLKLPCRDFDVASQFISDEDMLLSSLWEEGKFQRLTDKKYLIIMNSIGLPGFGSITPEIEIMLEHKNGKVTLESYDWTLRGDSEKVLKDSKFMKSFDIKLQGTLSISPSSGHVEANQKPIMEAVGHVEYKVEGAKPNIFKAAPPFLLSSVIDLIQEGVVDYTETQFTSRFLKAFRAHLMTIMQSQTKVL